MPVDLKARQRSYANRLGFEEEYGGPPAKPENTAAPTITGTATVGQTLTAVPGEWDGLPAPVVSRQWCADGAGIAGATGLSLILTPALAGTVITVKEWGHNVVGGAVAESDGTSAVAGAAPVNTVAPSITGTAKVGETLTATDGTWTGTPTPELTRQWLADDEPIEGATEATFDLTEDEEGKVIAVEVTGENLMGTASATSDPTDPVVEAD